ncbi:MAG: acyl-CoA thioesterase [Alistipes sp.]|nr:acyl-CoA thioesterase [Alistipes sp.]
MKRKNREAALTSRCPVQVRFSEVDSMHIVWHGQYVRYFEDGREAFGCQYPGLGYMEIYRCGYTAPIVDLQLEFKNPLRYGERAVVETRYIDTDAAKICFEYIITRESDGATVATGSTVQVFLNGDNELELVNPEFYLEWKKKWRVR